MKTINIIGAGIAGSISATLLRAEGFDVRVIDDHDVYSASQASSNLFVADWYKGVEGATEGLAVLERLYGKVTEKPFQAGIKIAPKMLHIPQRALLVQPDVVQTVTYADRHGVTLGDGTNFEGPIVLCCGYRHNALSLGHRAEEKIDIGIYAGHRLLIAGELAQGKLEMVAPYKHGKLYQYDKGVIYYADSVKVKLDKYREREDELRERTIERAKKAIGADTLDVIDFRVGYRPVLKNAPMGVLLRGQNDIWTINGGGKNGVVSYAYRASQLLTEMRKLK